MSPSSEVPLRQFLLVFAIRIAPYVSVNLGLAFGLALACLLCPPPMLTHSFENTPPCHLASTNLWPPTDSVTVNIALVVDLKALYNPVTTHF